MQNLDLFLLFCRKLQLLGIDYMVTGSVATILYGEPRLTHDIDIVIFVKHFDPEKFAQAFPFDDFYCPPPEVLHVESRRQQRGHFNLIHHETGFKADIYIAPHDSFYQWAFENINSIPIGEESIRVAPPEYVLINKLTYFREGGSHKHLDDIRGMIERSENNLDWQIIEAEAARRGLQKELKELSCK